jgi:hypothetical protein
VEPRSLDVESGPRWRVLLGAAGALLFGAFLATGVGRVFHGNASALFYFGDRWSAGALPADALVRPGPGYDGQFYYRVALDPALSVRQLWNGETAAAPGVDTPLYRYRRIAYPLVARFFALGNPSWLPWTFPLVSVLGAALGVFSMTGLFEEFGWSGAWGISYALLPGLVFAASRNLCEGLAVALLCAALLAMVRRRLGVTLLLLIASHLAHEMTVVVSVGFLASACARRRWTEAALFLVPVGLTIAWAVIVSAGFGAADTLVSARGGGAGIGIPGEGLLHKLEWLRRPKHASGVYALVQTDRRSWRQEALLLAPILLGLTVLAHAGFRRRTDTWITGLLAAGLALSFSDQVWRDAASYARVTSVMLLLALRSIAEAPSPIGIALLVSLPFGSVAALGWCWDDWWKWSLG